MDENKDVSNTFFCFICLIMSLNISGSLFGFSSSLLLLVPFVFLSVFFLNGAVFCTTGIAVHVAVVAVAICHVICMCGTWECLTELYLTGVLVYTYVKGNAEDVPKIAEDVPRPPDMSSGCVCTP